MMLMKKEKNEQSITYASAHFHTATPTGSSSHYPSAGTRHANSYANEALAIRATYSVQ